MSKKLSCRFKAGMHCDKIAKLQKELDFQMDRAKTWKREYHAMLDKASLLALKTSELREAKREAEAKLTTTKAELRSYRRAFNVMRIINIIFTVGFVVMTAILIWR